ncbi:MAG: ABC transporter permease [Bacteroidaceae bacterium]|nr:ABC transporter permease [Bacteroidaceae bacterium]
MYFLAKRFFRGHTNTRRGASKPAIRVAICGIALGLAVMLLSVSVLAGFKEELTKKITGFAAEIEVLNLATLQLPDAHPISLPPYIEEKIQNIENVTHLQKVALKIGVLKTGTHFKPIHLKGIDETYDTTYLNEALIEGRLPVLSPDSATNEIVLSRRIANTLDLKVGERIYAYFFEDNIKMRRMHIVGIYDTNLKQFDESTVITDRYTVCKLNGWSNKEYSEIELNTASFDKLDQTLQQVREALNGFHKISAISVNEHYPQVFSWLNILNTNVWVVLALMLGVAVFTVSSGLLIIMLERTPAIGILKAMGATDGQLRATFIKLAMLITARGVLLGNTIARTLLILQQKFHFVKLDPDHYYVTEVHVVINPYIIVLINAVTVLLIFLSLFIPTLVLSKITPVKAIKFD